MRLLRRVLGLLLFLFSSFASLPAAGPREDLLVTASWVADRLRDPDLVLLHVGERAEYDRRHLPGSRFLDLMDISAPMDHDSPNPATLSLELPDPGPLRTALSGFGISDRSTIVVYQSNNWHSPATRAVWTLYFAGLGGRTKLLDGGLRAWVDGGHPVTTEVPAARTGSLAPLKTLNVTVDAAFVMANRATPGIAIVDGRARSYFDGTQNAGRPDAPQLGHIPGARSIPFTSMFDDTGTLVAADKLAAIFAEAGIKPGDEVIGYCHIGQQATAMLFAARTLGYRVRLYDGSMNDWSRRGLPLERPAGRGGGR